MFDALSDAATKIPSVRRFRVGRRLTHGAEYEQMMREDYPYCAVIEFDDFDGLTSYLKHPHHETLGALFYQMLDGALAYDYETSTTSQLPTA